MWVITRDLLHEDGQDMPSRVGTGSANYDPEKFAKSVTIPIRLLDDDGEVHYEGRSTWKRICDSPEWVAFEPLDWAKDDSGCTELQYQETPGQWETL